MKQPPSPITQQLPAPVPISSDCRRRNPRNKSRSCQGRRVEKLGPDFGARLRAARKRDCPCSEPWLLISLTLLRLVTTRPATRLLRVKQYPRGRLTARPAPLSRLRRGARETRRGQANSSNYLSTCTVSKLDASVWPAAAGLRNACDFTRISSRGTCSRSYLLDCVTSLGVYIVA